MASWSVPKVSRPYYTMTKVCWRTIMQPYCFICCKMKDQTSWRTLVKLIGRASGNTASHWSWIQVDQTYIFKIYKSTSNCWVNSRTIWLWVSRTSKMSKTDCWWCPSRLNVLTSVMEPRVLNSTKPGVGGSSRNSSNRFCIIPICFRATWSDKSR